MRTLLIAFGFTLLIHALFLGMEPSWLKKEPPARLNPRTVTMSLVHHRPLKQENKPVVKELVPPPKEETPVKKIVQKPKKRPRKIHPVVRPAVPAEKKRLPEPDLSPIYEKAEKVDRSAPKVPETFSIKETLKVVDASHFVSEVQEAIPLYKNNPPPKYPKLARKKGYQGTVILEALVDQNGAVDDVKIFKSSGYSILDRKAAESVKRWLFKPGMKGNKKVEMWVRVPIRFQLK